MSAVEVGSSKAGRKRRIEVEDLSKVEFETSEGVEVVQSFNKMGLNKHLLRGICSYGFKKPSAIQQRAIKQIIRGRDVIARAQCGTGKTAALSMGVLQLIELKSRETQALVLAPTPELALQIQKVILGLGQYMKVQCHACVSGTDVPEDIRKLDFGQHIVTGTPGRIFDLIQRRKLRTPHIKMLVLDEADEMLSERFKKRIFDIHRHLPPDVQVVMVSENFPHDVLAMTSKLMTDDPIRILVKHDELLLKRVKHFFVAVENEEWKFDIVYDLYDTISIAQAVIFCNSLHKAAWLADKMSNANFTVGCMHTDLELKDRDDIMRLFRAGESRVLICTDASARGLDFPQFSLLINYDFPNDRELYIRRIGRSGHYGRKRVAINFVNNDDIHAMRLIEEYYSIQIVELPTNVGELAEESTKGMIEGKNI